MALLELFLRAGIVLLTNHAKMKLGRGCNLGRISALSTLCRVVALVLGTSSIRAEDPVLAWDDMMLQAIRTETSNPTLSSRNLAILHGAIYDAVNSIEGSHQPFMVQAHAEPGASYEAAAIEAGYQVMLALYPSSQAKTEMLYSFLSGTLPADASTINGLAVGLATAESILDWRSADGSSLNITYIPSDSPGAWRRTPPFFRPPADPQWGYVDPFCLGDIEPFVPKGPPALDSAEYATAFAEIKKLGGKTNTTRTAEQSDIARFWSDFTNTATPPGHWQEIAATNSVAQDKTLVENARLFALLSFAQADSAIVCWESKFRYNFWRPITAVQRADEDGNDATEKDANWSSFLNTPPFPEYTSGHSTFSKASAVVLAFFFGTDAMNFATKSDSLAGLRHYTSFSSCAEEIGRSRIYGGIHFEFSNVDGKKCGQQIGEYVSRNYLLPNASLPLVHLESFTQNQHALRIHGHVSKNFVLEGSTNLSAWTPLSTNASVSGGVMITNSINENSPTWFYRIRE